MNPCPGILLVRLILCVGAMDLARPLQQHYQSWAELGTDYVAGHDLWKGSNDSDVDEALTQLIDPNNADSPWNSIPWNTDLD
jgi:Protein of unknown function (DUF1266)